MTVTVAGPPTLIPPASRSWASRSATASRRRSRDADVIMMLRLQQERMHGRLHPVAPRVLAALGAHPRQARSAARPDVLIMHPGPVNRGVEMSPEVADGPYSVILDQVTNGVAVRMAVLYPAGAEERGGGMNLLIQERPRGRSRQRRSTRVAGRARSPTAASHRVGPRPRGRPRAPRRSTPTGKVVVPGLHRHARPPARAGLRVQGDHRDAAPGRRRRAASPRCAAWPTRFPVNDNRAVTDYILAKARRSRASCASTRSAR